MYNVFNSTDTPDAKLCCISAPVGGSLIRHRRKLEKLYRLPTQPQKNYLYNGRFYKVFSATIIFEATGMTKVTDKIDTLSNLISPRVDIKRPIYNWHSFKHSYSKGLVDNLITEFGLKTGFLGNGFILRRRNNFTCV